MSDNNLYIKVVDNNDTLAFIKSNRSSVARFGDGEMDIIAGHSIPYQQYDACLAHELQMILKYQSHADFVVCLPDVFEKLERYNEPCRSFWQGHFNVYRDLYKKTCVASWYGSTFISRPYIDLEDKTPAKKYFEALRELWENQDVLIVEGQTSRSGVGNDLFENAKSIQRIICPSKNAFSQYEAIESAIRQYGKDKLILLSLGPTAKVLSYHLSQEGYWLVDLGHIDSEYEWFKMGATYKVKLEHKHTAEHNYDENIVFLEDAQYNQQIVCRVDEIADKKRIDIVFAVNDRFAVHLGPTILSFLTHHKNYNVHCHVLHAGIKDNIMTDLKQLSQFEGVFIHFHCVNHPELLSISYVTEQFPIESFFRLVTPQVLSDVDRALYLDVDILVKQSVGHLFELDMENYEIGAVVDRGMYAFYAWHLNQLNFTENDKYFNSGVLLMNLKAMREHQTTQKLLDLIPLRAYKFFDQDILNIFYKNNYLCLDVIYNYTDKCKLDNVSNPDDVIIEHFNGDIKPWHAYHKVPTYIKSSVKLYKQYQQQYYQLFDKAWVTVVVCVDEHIDYVADAIGTVFEQTYPFVKVVVLDKTQTITSEKLDHEGVKIIYGNRYLPKTLIHAVDTPYVTFMAGDSWLDTTYIETLLTALNIKNADMSVTSFTELNDENGTYVFRDAHFKATVFCHQDILTSLSTFNWFEQTIMTSLYGKLYVTDNVKACMTFDMSAQQLAYALLCCSKNIAISELKKYVVRSYGEQLQSEAYYLDVLRDEQFFNHLLTLLNYQQVGDYRQKLVDLYDIAITHEFHELRQQVMTYLNNN